MRKSRFVHIKKNEILMGLAGGAAFAVTWLLLTGFEEILKPVTGGVFFFVVWVIASTTAKD